MQKIVQVIEEVEKQKTKQNNLVKNPHHYTSGNIECIDAIRASMSKEGFSDYCKGNVMKYIWRYKSKNGTQDLEKAQVYLNWLIGNETV